MLLPTSMDVMTGLAPSSLRRLSARRFEARCGRCLRFSLPVEAVGPEHAWSELIKEGWTWYTSPGGGTGCASCMECLKASRPEAERGANPSCTNDTGKWSNADDSVSLGEFIEEVEVGASMEAGARGLTLAVTPVEPGVEVKVDRQLLAAAVANLLQNAFKFTRPHGHISLRTSSTKDHVLIEVEDECGGLPPGSANELFRPFERRSHNRSGLGLGLSISRKSVQAEGGEIHVRDRPGIGCVFTIDLPRLSPAP